MGTATRRCFFLGIIVAFVIIPFLARAQTTDSLEQELNALLAEIAALQQQLISLPPATLPAAPAPSSTPVPTPPAWLISKCPSLSRNLSRGMRGQDVFSLQVFLDQEGFFYGEPTGFFGPTTEASVQEWQSAQGVIRSGTPESGFGVVGPRTRATILDRCDPAAPTSCQVAPPPTTACSTGWQATTDKYGCTTSYKCTLPRTESASCPRYLPLSCPNGTLVSNGTDSNGCGLGFRCITATTQPSISISNTPLNLARGQTLTVSWSSQNVPTGSKVRLEIYKSGDSIAQSNNDRGLTSATSQLSVSGSYIWTIPSEGGAILADAGWGGYSLISGQYKIIAKLYTGDTCWGYCYPAPTRTVHATGEGTVFTVQ